MMTAQGLAQCKLTAEHSCWSINSDSVSSLRGAGQAYVLGLSPAIKLPAPPSFTSS